MKATLAPHITGMKGWRGLHPARYLALNGRRGVEKKKHAQWRWGKKKALRRARRRFSKALVDLEC